MLTPKERLRMILAGQQADRPACICPGGMMNMVTSELMDRVKVYMPEAHRDARQMAELAKAVYEEGCFENYGVPFCMTVEAEEMGAEVDMGTSVYEPHVTGYVIESVSELEKLRPVDVTKGRAKVTLDAIRILKEETEDVPIVGNLTGPISTASSVMAGADIIAISDPSGTGEILGPKYFKEFAVTYINRLLDALQEEKMGTIVHICGQMSPVYKEVHEVRSSALSFDSIVPMKEAREHLKDRVLMGNVSTYALEFGDPDRVKMLTKSCVKSGSDIISPACGLGMKSPLRNVQSILECLTDAQ